MDSSFFFGIYFRDVNVKVIIFENWYIVEKVENLDK